MTTLQENQDRGSLDDRLIDRLADGALSDVERCAVLARLDLEPDGWRRCALAFLEAQCWREALNPMARLREGEAPFEPRRPQARTEPCPPGIRQGPSMRLRSAAAIAAGLVAAFAAGWSVRGVGVPPAATDQRAVVQVPSAAVLEKPPAGAQPEPVSTRSPSAAPLPEPVVKAWERRGYEVQRSQRLVSMELQGGRRVTVPIDEVRLRFVGDRTY
jgi:hypothetical protein